MPFYDYVCKNPQCSAAWEEEARITAPAATHCPSCHEPTASRQIGKTNTKFMGPGWYGTGGYAATPPRTK